jgi:hypothetical protein
MRSAATRMRCEGTQIIITYKQDREQGAKKGRCAFADG